MLTRRVFLKSGGMALVTIGAGPAFLNRAALAAAAPGPHMRRKVLVTIFQRGAMDGMMAVTPLDDATLRQLRLRQPGSSVVLDTVDEAYRQWRATGVAPGAQILDALRSLVMQLGTYHR